MLELKMIEGQRRDKRQQRAGNCRGGARRKAKNIGRYCIVRRAWNAGSYWGRGSLFVF